MTGRFRAAASQRAVRMGLGALGLLLASAAASGQASGCLAPDTVPASSVAPPLLLGGDDFRTEPCARIVDGMVHVVLMAQGPASKTMEPAQFTAESLDVLEQHVVEMEALRRLRALSAAGTAGHAAARSLQQTGEALAGVVTRPVESVVGLPAGVLRAVGQRAGQIGRQVADAGERATEAFETPPEAMAGLRPRPTQAAAPEAEPWWRTGGGFALRLGQRWLGYNAARRELARALGIDPYAINPWLDAEMDRLAWSSLAGRRGVGAGLGQIGGAAGTVLGQGGRIHRMVWEKPPEEVTAWNAARLAPLACSAEVQDAFLDNARYSPTLQTQAVDALLDLVPQVGCDAFLSQAARVKREVEARFVVDALHLLVAARPHFPTRFEAFGEALVLRDGEARLWVALPLDQLAWNEASRRFFSAPDFAAIEDKRVLLGRRANPDARQALLRAGWMVVEDAIGPAREARARALGGGEAP